jgi:hypothetical protein
MIAIGLATLVVCACSKQQPADQNISIDAGVPDNQMGGNADIVSLPPDESSTTPTNQLQNGFDAPDVNDSGNAGNSY